MQAIKWALALIAGGLIAMGLVAFWAVLVAAAYALFWVTLIGVLAYGIAKLLLPSPRKKP